MVDVAATPLYRHRVVATGYDALNALLWLPAGSNRLRRAFVRTLDLQPEQSVLELGCGTGLVTRHLCAAGARVSAVDRSGNMLIAARSRAPHAEVTQADIGTVALDGVFDWVVLAFVVHELTPAQRVVVLRRSAERLGPDGKIAILDWARPSGVIAGRLWSAIVRAIEPPVAFDVLTSGLYRAATDAKLVVTGEHRVAQGRARILHLRPATRLSSTGAAPVAPCPGGVKVDAERNAGAR